VLCELLGQLWMMPPDPSIFVSLRERVADAGALTAQRLRAGGLRIDPGLLAEAAALPRDLSVSASGDRLLFGDLGVGNVLFSARGWLAIDPSPVFGDPAFDAARAIVQRNDFADVSGQISFLAGELGLDRVRVAAWVFSEVMGALGWCVEVGDADGVGAWLGCMREIVAARRSGAG
jgi:streptomycin 6-kinase